MRFTSHRDFSRAFERALVRAGIPMAYSSGFSPHPRISYAGAAPTGAASEAEYLEIGLRDTCDLAEVAERLDAALPTGLDVLEVVPARGGSLAERLAASRWVITLPDVGPDAAAAAVATFLHQGEVLVERMTKQGMRTFDCRGAVVSLESVGDQECAILEMVLRHGTPSVRPDDILSGLRHTAGLPGSAAAVFQRLAQGPLDDETGMVGDPLAPDRDAD
jgi:radical SAM-linked protein